MLVVSANWGFTDGTLFAPPIRRAHVVGWRRAVIRAALRAGFRRDGSYHPITGLDVVLAGDTLDGLVSAEWVGRARPWHADPAAAGLRRRVLRAAAGRAAPLLAVLAGWARGRLRLPAADARGRPRIDARAAVPVRVALLAGDRDPWIECWPDAVAARGFGAGRLWSNGTALVVHGEDFDPSCHVEDAHDGPRTGHVDRPPTLTESVAVDLVARFAVAIRDLRSADRLRDRLLAALAGAGPLEIQAAFAAWRTAPGSASLPGPVVDAWRRAVEDWWRETDRVPPSCAVSADPCSALAPWFEAAVLPAADAGRATPAVRELVGPTSGAPSVVLAPPARERGGAVVLGHPSPALPAGDGPAPVICLGRPPVRRCSGVVVVRDGAAAAAACVSAATAPAWPASVVLRSDADRVEWHDLEPGAREAVPTADDRPARVVDAA